MILFNEDEEKNTTLKISGVLQNKPSYPFKFTLYYSTICVQD